MTYPPCNSSHTRPRLFLLSLLTNLTLLSLLTNLPHLTLLTNLPLLTLLTNLTLLTLLTMQGVALLANSRLVAHYEGGIPLLDDTLCRFV